MAAPVLCSRRTPMKVLRLSAAAALALATGIVAHASGPIAVYAKDDRVVVEPNEQAPERIQVFGTFTLASASSANSFGTPVRGYLYYSLPTTGAAPSPPDVNRRTALNEWKDLKAVAGSGEIVAFGAQSNNPPRLHKADEKPASP